MVLVDQHRLTMENLDIKKWVEDASKEQTEFRAAVHTLFWAISNSEFLRERMYIKGGLLLALRYQSTRFTRDADFSTSEMYVEFEKDKFLAELKVRLSVAVESLDYNLDCRILSHKVNPSGDDKSFQTLSIKIGHAYKGSKKHKTLIRGNCPSVLEIDYSFNEQSRKIDVVCIDGENNNLLAYSLPDLIAEKFRSIIQQKVRKRVRRQDAYDIFILMSKIELEKKKLKKDVLASLLLKSESRNLKVDRRSLRDEEVIRRSKADYETLAQEIEGELQPFEEVYGKIRKYYESLPWDD